MRLLESRGPVQLGPAGGPSVEVAPGGRGLRVAGKAVGRSWTLRGGALHVEGRRVRGELTVHRIEGGLAVVNRVPLEAYVAGILGGEVYPNWEPATLRAQAVVARTYALHEARVHAGEHWDVSGDTAGQVYAGLDAETEALRAATRSTRGEWLAWDGRPILAAYHSASGGRTASSAEVWGRSLPYLVSQPVEHEEDSPDTYWRATVRGTTLGRALAPLGVPVGPVRELRVLDRWESGRARTIRVRGRDGATEITARALREALGAKVIRSTLFETRSASDGFLFVGSGHGHGVGMSQWGAEGLARRGASYREILAAFYPGAELVRGVAR